MISGDRSLAEGKHGAFYNTIEEFHKHWERIDIVCPRIFRGSIFGKIEIKPQFGNVFLHPSPWPIFLQSLWIWKKGREIYKNRHFDIATIHEYPPFYNGLGAKFLFMEFKVPYILEIMHVPGLPKAGNFKERLYKWLLKFFIKCDASSAKKVRVINQHQTPGFLLKAGIKKEQLIYIPAFYIDLEVFKPLDVKKEYDLVFAARLERNKGIFELLKAVVLVKKQKPDVKLLLIGSGSLKPGLQKFMEENDLKNNVIFSGWLATSEDVTRAYNSARIFVNPSYNEGGPRVVLEAMACGLPVITTPVGLMVDIIKNNQNGLLTDWSPIRMAEDIRSLLEDKNSQRRLLLEGLELVKNFEKKSAVKNYADKIKALI